jgi:hypothetical protein
MLDPQTEHMKTTEEVLLHTSGRKRCFFPTPEQPPLLAA